MASLGNIIRVSHKSDRPSSFTSSVSGNGTLNSRNGAVLPNPLQQQHSVRTRAASRRSVTPTSRTARPLPVDNDSESERVRVAVRLRPRNAEEQSDADYSDCVEVHPELRRLKLRKNNWTSDSYRFDEIFTASASQKRVYEAVAKPVVESVLDGFNGTVMAYGQTGTGKTYTLGNPGRKDPSERGIMVRALEDILASTSASDSVEISYLQLYMECIQDLLAPEKTNISIVEDVRTGEVQVPGVELVRIQSMDQFLRLLQVGEVNRHAANTKMNTESSRSHAILMVCIRRSVCSKEEVDMDRVHRMPMIRKSKLLLVDLAGSERLDKSGSEGHLLEEAKFINLSLTSLGKCINALAENSPHIPTRDSKLTRLLRDSFGGSARTSLIVTTGPSSRHHAETASTVLFGQRAMKVVNAVKVREEFDYEGFCRKLEAQVDRLSAELERQQSLRENDNLEMQKLVQEHKMSSARSESNMKDSLQELDGFRQKNKRLLDEVARLQTCLNNCKQQQLENSTYQKMLAETTQMHEERVADLTKQITEIQVLLQETQSENLEYRKALADTTKMYEERIEALSQHLADEQSHSNEIEEMNYTKKLLKEYQNSVEINAKKEINELQTRLQEMHNVHETTKNDLRSLSLEYKNLESEKTKLENELHTTRQALRVEETRRKEAEKKLCNLTKVVPETEDAFEEKTTYVHENKTRMSSSLHYEQNLQKSSRSRETIVTQRNTIAKICEEVGLQKILSLLESRDSDVQIHAVKVVANLAAEDINQERIAQEGGLDALLMLVETSHDTTILRVASGAIANLAMNETNQGLITKKGGAKLLAKAGSKTDDPQTLRMVAGAIANLCGNEKLHIILKEDGAIKALLELASSRHGDVISQVARGLANFAKCESRKIMQDHWRGRSLLMEDGALSWLVANLNTTSSSTRRHIELAICHLAQNGENAEDFTTTGGLEELRLISDKSAREDIRNLAKKTLESNTLFQGELRAKS